ncbi:MAG: hypothetical protein MZV63_10445 [Marinilabiliales bacterium]|nr:hypothetical protein [Marinilabiliales bacterium]
MTLRVYDISGKVVATPVNVAVSTSPGNTWNGLISRQRGWRRGSTIFPLVSADQTLKRKMIVE